MENLNEYLQALVTTGAAALHLEPNKEPYVVSRDGSTNIGISPLQGTQISMMVFPLIPPDVKQELPGKSEIEFVHPHKLCRFGFVVRKSPAGFMVTVRPDGAAPAGLTDPPGEPELSVEAASEPPPSNSSAKLSSAYETETISISSSPRSQMPDAAAFEFETNGSGRADADLAPEEDMGGPPTATPESFNFNLSGFVPSAEEYIPEPEPLGSDVSVLPLVDRRKGDRRRSNALSNDRMDALLWTASGSHASDLHLSPCVPPMIRKDGRPVILDCGEDVLSPQTSHELIISIMPPANLDEFERTGNTRFAYEIEGQARFRCNVFTDRKGTAAVLRMIPSDVPTAEQLELPTPILDLCSLSDGLVIVAGPSGSGKSTTLAAMIDTINKSREGYIITVEDPIEFVHESHKCLVSQRENSRCTVAPDSVLRSARLESPDVLLVSELGEEQALSHSIECAAGGSLVLGSISAMCARMAVEMVVDKFGAALKTNGLRMLAETLRCVVIQKLVPAADGGRMAVFDVLSVTPEISELIREGRISEVAAAG